MRIRGRYLVLAWTAVFLAAMGVIVVRDQRGFAVGRHLETLDDSVRALQSVQAELDADITTLSSRNVLGDKLKARGMRFASDSELLSIPLPPR
jgi:cell division protein FtsL